MKKTIQLKESDITRMVMEAVNELDWKTGIAAARSAEKKNDPRKEKFLKYATDRIKEKYPNTHDEYSFDTHSGSAHINPYLATKYGYLNYNDEVSSSVGNTHSDYHKSFGDRGVKGYGNYYLDRKRLPWPFENGKDVNPPHFENGKSDWDDMSQDMEDFYTGHSEYKPGKGWTKKNESIVREAVNRTLRKYIR